MKLWMIGREGDTQIWLTPKGVILYVEQPTARRPKWRRFEWSGTDDEFEDAVAEIEAMLQ